MNRLNAFYNTTSESILCGNKVGAKTKGWRSTSSSEEFSCHNHAILGSNSLPASELGVQCSLSRARHTLS